jgi:hypothetical protein
MMNNEKRGAFTGSPLRSVELRQCLACLTGLEGELGFELNDAWRSVRA